MKALRAFLLISTVVLAQSPDAKPAPPTLGGLGLSYPLSTDWVLATTLMRNQAVAQNHSADSIVLAAVYVPKKILSQSSPFFSLVAFRYAHPDCPQFLDAMDAQLQKQEKTKIGETKQPFSAGGRDFFRTDFEQKGVLRHRALICTTAQDYVLVWNAGARDEKGLEAVVSTLDSITATSAPAPSATTVAAARDSEEAGASGVLQKVRLASGVMGGRLVKKVAPVYPQEARAAYIQGTVILGADISKQGDIVKLELISGPIELAGSAVDAVRRWKYLPYLLNGEPVEVQTQIQVNYQLSY
jgi:TonB family protein